MEAQKVVIQGITSGSVLLEDKTGGFHRFNLLGSKVSTENFMQMCVYSSTISKYPKQETIYMSIARGLGKNSAYAIQKTLCKVKKI